MKATVVPQEGVETEWMNRLKDPLKSIEQVLKDMPPGLKDYQQIVFERLFEATLQDVRGTPARAPVPGASVAPRTVTGVASFQKFMTDYAFSMEALANVVDVQSVQVLSRNLATTKSESQRKIAALLALANAYKTGEFSVTREQLVEACKLHGVYDSANFATNMTSDFEDSVIFIRDPSSGTYRVSRPGEGYVASVVRSLIPPANGGSPP